MLGLLDQKKIRKVKIVKQEDINKVSERSQAGGRATGGRGWTGGATHGATCSRCLTGGREGSDGTNIGNGWMVTCCCECACVVMCRFNGTG